MTLNKYQRALLARIERVADSIGDVAPGKRFTLLNATGYLRSSFERMPDEGPAEPDEAAGTPAQIKDRYIANQAIFAALQAGRRLTFMDRKEFKCSEMNTQITVIRQKIRDGKLPGHLCQEKIEFAPGKYCQRYWWQPEKEDVVCRYRI